MKYDRIELEDGSTMIVCSSRTRRGHHCACGSLATLLCDQPLTGGRTCDRPLCERCATEVAADFHLCPQHMRFRHGSQEELNLGTLVAAGDRP